MAYNPYQSLSALVSKPPLQVGTVRLAGLGVVVIELPGGGTVNIRGDAAVGDKVFFRDGVIESQAKPLPVVQIRV